jgi:hypothetical protein
MTARLFFFLLISRVVVLFLNICQADKPITASMSYDLFSLIRSLSCKKIIKADLLKDATNTLKLLKIDVNK